MPSHRSIVIGATLATLALASSVGAATFNLSWQSDPNVDFDITFSTNYSLEADGVLTINKAAGETFGAADAYGRVEISNYQSGASEPFFVTAIAALAGMIAADGLTATITDFLMTGDGTSFGCVSPENDCGLAGQSFYNIVSFDGTTEDGVAYSSTGGAQASFQLTLSLFDPSPQPVPVPLPATLPLLLGGLWAVCRLRRRR